MTLRDTSCASLTSVLRPQQFPHDGRRVERLSLLQLLSVVQDDVGDWMLLHDATPWGQFVAGARRLLVTK